MQIPISLSTIAVYASFFVSVSQVDSSKLSSTVSCIMHYLYFDSPSQKTNSHYLCLICDKSDDLQTWRLKFETGLSVAIFYLRWLATGSEGTELLGLAQMGKLGLRRGGLPAWSIR